MTPDEAAVNEAIEQTIADGRASERLLGDPIFQKTVLAVETNIHDEWASATSLSEREAAHFEIKALTRILVELRAAADRAEVELMMQSGETARFGVA